MGHVLTTGGGSPVKVGGAAGLVQRLRPQARATGDEVGLERLQSKLCGLQSELEKTRRQLATEREEFHLKEAQMEISLNTAHKANQELEVPPTSPPPSFLHLSFLFIHSPCLLLLPLSLSLLCLPPSILKTGCYSI